MSSPTSVITLELPRWPLGDRLAVLLMLAAGGVTEAMLARYPDAPVGLGLAAAGLLTLGLWRDRRRRPRALEFAPLAGRLRFEDGTAVAFQPGNGVRLLGGSLVLHWRARGRSGRLWLTAADVPPEMLRIVAVRLVAGQ